jgi:hypothetical protein
MFSALKTSWLFLNPNPPPAIRAPEVFGLFPEHAGYVD